MNVSVVIRTYDRPEMLARAVASVKMQTVKPSQIVVVNDGLQSVDVGDGVEVLNTGGVGKGAAANVGIDWSRGDVIAFLDDDDYWLPNHIETVHRYSKFDVAYTGTRVEGASSYVHVWEFNESDLALGRRSPILCSVVISRMALDRVGGFDVAMKSVCDDWDLYVRLSWLYRFVEIPIVTAVYTFPEGNKAYNRGEKMRAAWTRIHEKNPGRKYVLSSEDAASLASKLIWYEEQLEGYRRQER